MAICEELVTSLLNGTDFNYMVHHDCMKKPVRRRRRRGSRQIQQHLVGGGAMWEVRSAVYWII